jgi:hypothetical protein
MAQVVECLPTKHKELSLNPSTRKEGKKGGRRERKRERERDKEKERKKEGREGGRKEGRNKSLVETELGVVCAPVTPALGRPRRED